MIRKIVEFRRLAPLAALVSLVATAACDRGRHTEVETGEVTESWEPKAADAVRGVPRAEVTSAIQARLDGKRDGALSRAHWQHVQTIYSRYSAAPLWLNEDGVDQRAGELTRALAHAPTEGLRLDAYPLEQLQRALTVVRETRRPTAEQLADADVLLTATYVALAEDLLTGQIDPKKISQEWHIDPEEADIDSALAQTIRLEPLARAIVQLRPQSEEYNALRQDLAQYRAIVARGGWPKIPGGEKLKAGDTAPVARLQAVQQRLQAEGYLPANHRLALAPNRAERAVYDSTLAAAVSEYQRRHAIAVDGILGGETLTSMNVSADFRVGQIAGNLERHRWLPRSLGERYIFVNVPAFRLWAFDEGKEVMTMKVVVGSEYNERATPAFADSMSYIEFSPYWNVPENIANEELWPKIQADPSYLARNNYEIVTENGKQRIRQRPGPKNALGNVKFMFPNQFAIYLHDSPEDHLFDRDVRAFSHGCIRVERPVDLAKWVLSGKPEWDDERIRGSMGLPKPRQVTLDRKVPVYIVYFTAYREEDRLHFGNDLYDRDSNLVREISDALTPSAEVQRALEALRDLTA